jgi:hypothetical protein
LAIYVGHLVLLRFSSVGGNDGLAMQLLRDTTIHINFCRGNLLENVHLEDTDVDGSYFVRFESLCSSFMLKEVVA